jgi:hypothetical protein
MTPRATHYFIPRRFEIGSLHRVVAGRCQRLRQRSNFKLGTIHVGVGMAR